MSTSLSVTTPPIVQLGGVIINEALAGNTTTNMDTDFYAFSDWVELYNSSNQAIDLSGYYLSDDPSKPTDWEIPAGTIIEAKGYLLAWTDKEDVKAKELHSNFSLSSSGEVLTLADTSGDVINTFEFGELESNVSAGLSFRTKFKTRLNELLTTTFTEVFLMPILDKINDERKGYIRLEKFTILSTDENVNAYVDYIENDVRSFIRERTAIVQQQLNDVIPN